MKGKQRIEECKVEDVIDISTGATGLGNSEEGVGLGETWTCWGNIL